MIIFSSLFTTAKTKNKKNIDYIIDDGESVTQKDIDLVDKEIIEELKFFYDDNQ